MGKYTKFGSSTFDQMMDREINAIVHRIKSFSTDWEGLYLLGGYGRGEGTVFKSKDNELAFNDYDFVLVSKPLSYWKLRRLRRDVKHFAQNALNTFSIPVDLYVHTPKTLGHLEPSLFNYEMVLGSKLIFGKRDYLQDYQAERIPKIPLSEGTRLLLNRGALLLYNQKSLSKYIYKVHLAMGDALLLALDDYDLYYENKKKNIQKTTLFPKLQKWYLNAIDLKQEMNEEKLNALAPLMQETIDQFLEFFLWFEEKRLGVSFPNFKAYRDDRQGEKSIKALLLNLMHFREKAFFPDFQLALLHPRERLFRALPDLLQKKPQDFLSLPAFIESQKRFG